jgi:hypothetical protein
MSLSSSDLVAQLQSEGFQVTAGYLSYLLREHTVLRPDERLSGLFVWSPADVDRLKAALRERDRGPVLRPQDTEMLAGSTIGAAGSASQTRPQAGKPHQHLNKKHAGGQPANGPGMKRNRASDNWPGGAPGAADPDQEEQRRS